METYRVAGNSQCFAERFEHWEMPIGTTLDDCLIELVKRTGCNPASLRHAGIVIDDRTVAKALWSYTRPKPGATVIVRALPGDDFASLFVTIAGFALAAAIPGSGIAIGLLKAGIAVSSELAPAKAMRP